MSFVVKILTPADTDAVEIALWYESQVPGLGAAFLQEVSDAAQKLANFPEIHRIRFGDVRRARVHRFKFYGLYYIIQNSEVWVIAIHHGRRHPGWLKERRKRID